MSQGDAILASLYEALKRFREEGKEPPEAFGLTEEEIDLIADVAYRYDFDMISSGTPLRIWGHPIMIVKS